MLLPLCKQPMLFTHGAWLSQITALFVIPGTKNMGCRVCCRTRVESLSHQLDPGDKKDHSCRELYRGARRGGWQAEQEGEDNIYPAGERLSLILCICNLDPVGSLTFATEEMTEATRGDGLFTQRLSVCVTVVEISDRRPNRNSTPRTPFTDEWEITQLLAVAKKDSKGAQGCRRVMVLLTDSVEPLGFTLNKHCWEYEPVKPTEAHGNRPWKISCKKEKGEKHAFHCLHPAVTHVTSQSPSEASNSRRTHKYCRNEDDSNRREMADYAYLMGLNEQWYPLENITGRTAGDFHGSFTLRWIVHIRFPQVPPRSLQLAVCLEGQESKSARQGSPQALEAGITTTGKKEKVVGEKAVATTTVKTMSMMMTMKKEKEKKKEMKSPLWSELQNTSFLFWHLVEHG
ncbi:hypothetical protein ACRRTK_001520 [Alexandromys fortis]